jgi:glycine/D-amino acid oxidase-like deaminating enzyme
MLSLPKVQVSYWQEVAPKTNYPKLSQDLEVDVVIVGGGICGLTSAYLLKQAGLEVVVLEKSTIGSGTTSHTTGKVTSQHNLFYSDLSKRLGKDVARIYAQANQAAIGQIEQIIKKEKIECGWQSEDHYVYTTRLKQISNFREESKVAAQLGLPASIETNTPLPFQIAAAVKFSNQAYFNAQAYINGLAVAVNGDGSYVFENSRVSRIHDGQPAIVSANGFKIRAKDIIVATNVPTFPLLARGSYCLIEYPTTSYIVGAKTKEKLKGMYISPDSDNYSILPINNKDRLVLIGGRDHIRGPRNGSKRYGQLAAFAQEKLEANSIEYKWSAWDYIAYDNIPAVGKMYPWSNHLYVATAFKKWGLTNTKVAANILHDLITGQPNESAAIFTPHRMSPVKSIARVFIQHLRR